MLDWCDDAGAIWTWTCLHIWCDNAKHTLMTVCKHALFVPWHPCVTHCKRNNISNSCKTVQLLKVFDDVWWTSFNSWKMSPTICTSYGHGFEKWCAPLFLVPEMAQNKAVQFTSPAQLRPCCTGLPGKDETKGSRSIRDSGRKGWHRYCWNQSRRNHVESMYLPSGYD